jgi:hypothetical protein
MASAFLRLGTVPEGVVAAALRMEDELERLLAYEGTLEPRKLLAEELRTALEEP